MQQARFHMVSRRFSRIAISLTTVVVLLAVLGYGLISSVSAVPSTMNFQGRLTDASGVTMPDGLYNMQFKLFTASSGGSSVWNETRETTARVQVTNGLFATKLGEVTPIPASLFASGSLYFEITMATPGTATCNTVSCASWESPMTPRQQMATSAYAFQAENANSLGGVDSANFARRDTSNTFTGSTQVFQNTTNSTTAFQVQNAAGISLLGVDTVNNQLTIRGFDDNFTRGPELITDGDFSGAAWSATGWTTTITDANSDDQNGSATLITNQFAVIPGDYYQVTFDVSGHTYPVDCLQVSIGNNYGDDDFCAATQVSSGTDSLIIQASDADPLTFWAYGSSVTVSNVSVHHLTYAPSGGAIALQNAQGETTLEIRTGGINNTNGMKTVNTFIGLSSGANNISGYANTSLGNYSLQANTTGSSNTVVGSSSLKNNTTGSSNTVFGTDSMQANTSGSLNTAMGEYSLISNTIGNSNVAIGRQSLVDNTTGSANTAIGIQSMNNNVSGDNNVAIGYQSLGSNTTGSGNIAIGNEAGNQDIDGWNSGTNLQNSTAIGAYAQVQANNSIVLGSSFTTTKVGIGITVPSNMFSVSGRHYSTGSATRTSGSAIVTGTGTSWTSAMVGDIIIFADGVTKQVSSVASTTSLTMNSNSAVTDSSPVAYRMHYPGFQVSSNGDTWVQKTSTTAFRIQNSLGATSLFTADTTNSRIQIGSSTTDATGMVFALDSFNQASDPTGINGAMYYNTNLNKFRCYQNSAWADCIASVSGTANTSLSNIASTNLSAALNTTSGNLTLQTTTSGNIVLNAAGTTELQDDTNVGGNLTVAATKSLTLVGGTTAQRPGSPTEGMMYFDTDTDKLLIYSNGKWQADRSTATKIVSTSASGGTSGAVASQNPDGADFVNTSTTSAQTVINSAIASLPAAGGTVYLMEGTYVVDASINLAANVKFVGSGRGTVIKIKNATNAPMAAVSVPLNATNIIVQHMLLEGNKANNSSGGQYGILTSSNANNLKITDVIAQNFRNYGIGVGSGTNYADISNNTLTGNNEAGLNFSTVYHSTVKDNIVVANGTYGMAIDGYQNNVSGNIVRSNTGIGIYGYSFNTPFSDNTVSANGSIGMYIIGSTSTVTGNTVFINSTYGVFIGGDNIVVSGNAINDNVNAGIYMGNTTGSQIDTNRVSNNGSTGAISSILFTPGSTSSNNRITNNLISDTAGTAFAIAISNSSAVNTYLSGNTFSGTGATSISDLGTGTVFANQSKTAGGIDALYKQANSASAFQIQNASSVAVFTVNTTANNITLGSGTSLTLTGGNTASRPTSPTEGMVYFDTDTKQLLVYSNGKWQADRSDSVLVAANDSSNADKAAADYVANGDTAAVNDGDQIQINQALNAASGKKVVLLAGTYTIDSAVSVANNSTLTGIGDGTVVTLANSFNATITMIENSDKITGTGVTIRDLKVDGNASNQTGGTMDGIGIIGLGGGVGPTARVGGSVSNTTIVNMYGGIALYLTNSSHSSLNNNRVKNSTYGIYLNTSHYNTVSDNSSIGSDPGAYGIGLAASTNNTVTGNVTQGNGQGMLLDSSSQNTITSNVVTGNSDDGITLFGGNTNLVSSNRIHNNGDTTNNDGIYINASDANSVKDNYITDTSCSTNCYAINISNSTSDTNHLSSNTYSTTSGTATIRDIGTGTIYTNQSKTAGGLDTVFKQANSAAAFQIQNASSVAVFTVDTSANSVSLGTGTALTVSGATTLNGSLVANSTAVFKNSSDSTNAFQIQNAATTALLTANTSNMRLEIGSGVEVKLMGVGNTYNALTKDFTCTASEVINEIVIITGSGTVGRAGGGATNSAAVAGIVVAKPDTTTCTIALEGTVQVNYGSSIITIGDSVVTSGTPGQAMTNASPTAGAYIGKAISAKDGSNLGWVLLD